MKKERSMSDNNYYIHFNSRIEPGLNKKINAQLFALQKSGLIFEEMSIDEHVSNGNLMKKVLHNTLFFYKNKYDYEKTLNMISNDSIVYLRRNKADKYYVDFLRKLRSKGCKVLIELPTYPYFKDDFSKPKYWPAYIKEKLAIPHFKKYVDRFVTYSNDKEIFGVPTIKVKNGIYVDQIEARTPIDSNEINILAVATFRKHHGYERIIEGLHRYYSNGGNRNIILRMVGSGDEKQKYEDLVNEYELNDHVLFLGKMLGDELSHQYDIADIALGSFGMHKISVYNSSVLKVREYLAKGLPIVSGCHEDAFEDETFDYYLEFPNDDSVVEIEKIVDFYDHIYSTKSHTERIEMTNMIREYAKRQVNYDVVFKNVIDYLKEA